MAELIGFWALQILSIGVMLLFVHEYKRITHKHETMLHAIEHHAKPRSVFSSNIIIWIYVITTFTWIFVALSLYAYFYG